MKSKPRPKTPTNDTPINSALRQFEATEANLAKLDRLWSKISKLTPAGLQFGSDPKYEQLARLYADLLEALPKIDGWRPEAQPMDLNAIGQSRLDAMEIGETSAEISVETEIEAPGRELAKYRHELNKKRQLLIRRALTDLVSSISTTLELLSNRIPKK